MRPPIEVGPRGVVLTDLPASLRWWQGRTGTEDWDVQVKVVARTEMARFEHYGEVEYEVGSRKAEIRLLNPLESGRYYDMEKVLVHELVHLVLSPLDQAMVPRSLRELESAVDTLAYALVHQVREGSTHAESRASA